MIHWKNARHQSSIMDSGLLHDARQRHALNDEDTLRSSSINELPSGLLIDTAFSPGRLSSEAMPQCSNKLDTILN
jgi:hypothetical protein